MNKAASLLSILCGLSIALAPQSASADTCLLDSNGDGNADTDVDTDGAADDTGDGESLACGRFSKATPDNIDGDGATAIGSFAQAVGAGALAIGNDVSATGVGTSAVGGDASASGGGITSALGLGASAFGNGADANGEGSVALGFLADGTGNEAIATWRRSNRQRLIGDRHWWGRDRWRYDRRTSIG